MTKVVRGSVRPLPISSSAAEFLHSLGQILSEASLQNLGSEQRSELALDGVVDLLETLSEAHTVFSGATMLKADSCQGALTIRRNQGAYWLVWVRRQFGRGSAEYFGSDGYILCVSENGSCWFDEDDATAALRTIRNILNAPDLMLRSATW